jgi:hypothetical protein
MVDFWSTANNVKDAVLQASHFAVIYEEVRAWVPVFPGPWIIVENLAVGIVERTFQPRAGSVFVAVFENSVAHGASWQSQYCYFTRNTFIGQPRRSYLRRWR